ncbi:MAG: Unknown protein [uncultured Thiotrichaceae bacterium]|uniref:Uncharacterized protein n=1 Tax=uncultured Thiotrichaceae bacterium TaxID=298394 RepID=A0A6S6SV19_9GAMM|nr:MAG: Unknown protein [uncultured Thiotrichaceae bacterium]
MRLVTYGDAWVSKHEQVQTNASPLFTTKNQSFHNRRAFSPPPPPKHWLEKTRHIPASAWVSSNNTMKPDDPNDSMVEHKERDMRTKDTFVSDVSAIFSQTRLSLGTFFKRLRSTVVLSHPSTTPQTTQSQVTNSQQTGMQQPHAESEIQASQSVPKRSKKILTTVEDVTTHRRTPKVAHTLQHPIVNDITSQGGDTQIDASDVNHLRAKPKATLHSERNVITSVEYADEALVQDRPNVLPFRHKASTEETASENNTSDTSFPVITPGLRTVSHQSSTVAEKNWPVLPKRTTHPAQPSAIQLLREQQRQKHLEDAQRSPPWIV